MHHTWHSFACLFTACVFTMQVLQEHLRALKNPKGLHKLDTPPGVGSGMQSMLLPMELRLVLQGAVVKFEHHPLEVSLSSVLCLHCC